MSPGCAFAGHGSGDDLNSGSIEQKFMDLFSKRTRQAERGLGTGFKGLPMH